MGGGGALDLPLAAAGLREEGEGGALGCFTAGDGGAFGLEAAGFGVCLMIDDLGVCMVFLEVLRPLAGIIGGVG